MVRLLSLLASPLTRRIAVLNLFGLFALIVGFLYLNQHREELIDARVQSLRTQGEIIAASIAASGRVDVDTERPPKLEPSDRAAAEDRQREISLNPEQIAPLLGRLVSPTRTRARIYDRDGYLVIDSRSHSKRSDILPSDLPPPSGSSAPTSTNNPSPVFENMMNALWRYARRPDLPLYEDVGLGNGKTYPEVAVALTGAEQSFVRANAKGETILSVAVPVQRFHSVHGALLLSTLGDEIDTAIAAERWALIRIILFSASVMLTLSLLVAGSVINHFRRQRG